MKKRDELIDVCIEFLSVIKDKTAGADIEQWLNDNYGPESETYQKIANLVIEGVAHGWVANTEISGPHYRLQPSVRTDR